MNSPYPEKKVLIFSQNVMVRAAVSKNGLLLHIYRKNANVNSELYRDILVYFLLYANKLPLDG